MLGCEDAVVIGAATAGSLGDGGIDVTGTLSLPGLPPVQLRGTSERVSGGVGPSVVTQLRGSVGPGAAADGDHNGALYQGCARGGHPTETDRPSVSWMGWNSHTCWQQTASG